jgi:LacI family transcriptional regulator
VKKPTLKDIAKHLGVSTSTVSRALKNHPDISEAIRAEVKQVAESMKYHPNTFAAGLRQQRTNTIALIIPEITMFFFPSVIEGVEEVARRHGFHLMVMQSKDSLELEKENVQICCDHSVDGILISLSTTANDLEHLQHAREIGIPVVLFDKSLDNGIFDEIIIDDENASARCVDTLYNAGCRNIIGVFGNAMLSLSQRRMRGFKSAMKKYGLESNDTNILFAGSLKEAMEGLDDMLNQFKPDGIFGMSDEVIAASLPILKKHNIRIPTDCIITGISDGKLPLIAESPVNYLLHDGLKVGKLAADMLIERIQQSEALIDKRKVILELEMHINGENGILTK